jgi:hypothetical protein
LGRGLNSAEARDELVRFGVSAKRRPKYDAEIEHVEHHELARLYCMLGKPRAHLGEMIGDRQCSLAGYDNRFQNVLPPIHPRDIVTRSAYGCLTPV